MKRRPFTPTDSPLDYHPRRRSNELESLLWMFTIGLLVVSAIGLIVDLVRTMR